jgi:hypothetical protein
MESKEYEKMRQDCVIERTMREFRKVRLMLDDWNLVFYWLERYYLGTCAEYVEFMQMSAKY